MVQDILNNSAIATCDASIDNEMMARIWKITNRYNNKILEDFIYSDSWEFCGIVSAEALTLLQLIGYICKVAAYLTRGSIVIYLDNLKLVKRYNGKISKLSIRAE